MKKIDFFTRSEIEIDIDRISSILKSGIFNHENSNHLLFQSAFIELMIRLRDLLSKSEKYNNKMNFSDDIIITDSVKDITEAIIFVRDAICHIDSPKNMADKDNKIVSSFNVIFGKGNFMKLNNKDFNSDYEDDVCFFYGEQKLYLKRHIIRAFEEAKRELLGK